MLSLVALTAGLATTAAAFDCTGPYFNFFNRGGPAMSIQRLDPALSPGTQSGHLHSFDGGNGLLADMSFADTQRSKCSTARVKLDKSLYWRPTLFWNGNNTGYYRVPEQYLKIYYKFGDNNERVNVTDFPKDFQMIAGDPFKRADGDNPARVKWACLGENYARIDANGFPKGFTSCKMGLTAEITMPSCWNGNALDPKNPHDHMQWPTESGTGIDRCPTGFQVARFPEIFIEFWYDVSAFDDQYGADDVPWVLSQGDPTGYGFHADFRQGWEEGALSKATAETGYLNCGCGCGQEDMENFFGVENVNDNDDEEFQNCAANAVYPGDDLAVLEELPGCNPIQPGPARATVVTGEGCNAAPPAATGAPNATETYPVIPSSGGNQASVTNPANTVGDNVAQPTAAFPTLEIELPNKGLETSYHEQAPGPTPSRSPAELVEDDVESSPNSPSPTDLVPAGEAPAGGDAVCPAPSTITITPTVYVTAGANGAAVTSCDPGTVYATVTDVATVTVTKPANLIRHKRHGLLHHNK